MGETNVIVLKLSAKCVQKMGRLRQTKNMNKLEKLPFLKKSILRMTKDVFVKRKIVFVQNVVVTKLKRNQHERMEMKNEMSRT